MILWVNLHGGFSTGLALIGIYLGADVLRVMGAGATAAGDAMRRLRVLAPILVATAVATLLNPVGLGLYEYISRHLSARLVMDRTSEFMSPDFHQRPFLWFLALLIAAALVAAWSQRRLHLQEGMLLASFAALALYSRRHIPLFAIVVAPVVASQLSALALPEDGIFRRVAGLRDYLVRRNTAMGELEATLRGHLLPVAATIGLVAMAAVQLRSDVTPLGVSFDPTLQPVQAVEYLKGRQPLGPGFNQLEWGGY